MVRNSNYRTKAAKTKAAKKSSREKSQKKKSSNDRRSSHHHIISRAVGGPDVPENIYRCTVCWHEAWHQLLHLYLPFIIIRTIKKWTNEDGSLNKEKMGENEEKRKKNFRLWRKIFGDKTPAEAINFVEQEFLPLEKRFLAGELRESEDVRRARKPRK